MKNLLLSQNQDKFAQISSIFSKDISQELFDSYSTFFEDSINKVTNLVGLTESLEEAKDYFDLLEKWQFLLAKIAYKYNIKTPPSLRKFIKDFDRLDDLDQKKRLFSIIKEDSSLKKE